MMCLSASLFGFLLHRVHWASCICLCLSSNLKNYYFSHYFTISFSLSFWEPHNAYIGLLLCIIGYPLAYVDFSSFFPLCAPQICFQVCWFFLTAIQVWWTLLVAFCFFNSVIFFRSRIFVLFTISTSFLYSDFVYTLFSWFLLLCCLSFHLSLKVRTVILKSFSSKVYAYVLQRWFLEIYFVLWGALCFPVSLDVLLVFVENWPFEKSVTSPSLCKLVWKTFTNQQGVFWTSGAAQDEGLNSS